MLKITFLEFIIRGIPEGLLFTLAAHTFSKRGIVLNKYLFTSIIYSICVYLMRFLPIQNGADFILNLVVLIALSITINKIDIIKAIKAGVIIFLFMFISEGINIYAIQFIFKKDLNVIFLNPSTKILYTIPSLLIFGFVVIVYYTRLYKRKELKYVQY